MHALAVLAVVAAVVGRSEVTFVDTGAAHATRRVVLPGEAAAAFAAPDGAVIVPLATSDETVVLPLHGGLTRWQGRLFPLFFDEPDKLYAILPGLVATLSYPERLPIDRTEVAGLSGVRRAACSRDGRLVAIVPTPPSAAEVVLVATGAAGGSATIRLSVEAVAVAVAPSSGWVVVGLSDDTLQLLAFGAGRPLAALPVAGAIRALLPTSDGRGVLVGVGGAGGGAVVGVRVDPASSRPLLIRFRTPTPVAVQGLAGGGSEILALASDQLLVLERHGRKIRLRIPVPNARHLVALPKKPESALPEWSDR